MTMLSKMLIAAIIGAVAGNNHFPAWREMNSARSQSLRNVTSTADYRIAGEFSYPKRLGWSNRMVQRMAAKRRNQKRNKQAHKGK